MRELVEHLREGGHDVVVRLRGGLVRGTGLEHLALGQRVRRAPRDRQLAGLRRRRPAGDDHRLVARRVAGRVRSGQLDVVGLLREQVVRRVVSAGHAGHEDRSRAVLVLEHRRVQHVVGLVEEAALVRDEVVLGLVAGLDVASRAPPRARCAHVVCGARGRRAPRATRCEPARTDARDVAVRTRMPKTSSSDEHQAGDDRPDGRDDRRGGHPADDPAARGHRGRAVAGSRSAHDEVPDADDADEDGGRADDQAAGRRVVLGMAQEPPRQAQQDEGRRARRGTPMRAVVTMLAHETNQPSTPNQVAATSVAAPAISARPSPSRRCAGSRSRAPRPRARAAPPTRCATPSQIARSSRPRAANSRGTGPGVTGRRAGPGAPVGRTRRGRRAWTSPGQHGRAARGKTCGKPCWERTGQTPLVPVVDGPRGPCSRDAARRRRLGCAGGLVAARRRTATTPGPRLRRRASTPRAPSRTPTGPRLEGDVRSRRRAPR